MLTNQIKTGGLMKRFASAMLIAAFLAVAACAPLPPFEIKPVTPNLNIQSSQVRPLKIAVVIQDPMPYSVFYKGQGSYSRESTAETRSMGFMLERDLTKVVSDTLSQAFTQLVVLRDLPQPGQYDASVNLNIGQILLKEVVVITGETCDITAEWNMTVLDGQNRELFTKKGISPSHNFKFSIINSSHDIILGMNWGLSLILSELSREWGTILYNMEIPTAKR